MKKENGVFVISLDFELYWGMRDIKAIEDYKDNLLGERTVVPTLLKLFDEYGIHATWATVGFMFYENRQELFEGLPARQPLYENAQLSPYEHLKEIGSSEREDPFHYASSLIKMIASHPHQEIGSHTFSHYYCLEKGQTLETFRDDLRAAVRAAERHGLKLESLIFPRNQYDAGSIAVCREMGLKAYRGNESSWIYKPQSFADESLVKRAFRLMDSYINISGRNCYRQDEIKRSFPFNIPSSRFLRPYSGKLRALEPLRLRRILSDMSYAAKNKLVYHLWWHPHNFGVEQERNIAFLRSILDHFSKLRESDGMTSLNMGELSESLVGGEFPAAGRNGNKARTGDFTGVATPNDFPAPAHRSLRAGMS